MKKNINMCIVSESEPLKLTLNQKLESLGMTHVDTCNSLGDFLKKVASNFVDVVFVDSLVPDMTLEAAVDEIVSAQLKTVIFVVSSEDLPREAKKSLLYQGVSGFLLDEIEVQDLKSSLVRLI